MIQLLRSMVILSLFVSFCSAESNQSTQNEFGYIDKLHKNISEMIVRWSDAMDTTFNGWLEGNESNTTDLETNLTGAEENRTLSKENIRDNEDNRSTLETNTTAIVTEKVVVPVPMKSVKTDTTETENKSVMEKADKPSNTLEEKVHNVDKFFQNEKYLNETEDTYIRARVDNDLQSKGSNDFTIALRAQIPFSKSKKRFKIFIDDLTLDNADEMLHNTSKNDNTTPDIGLHYYASRHKILSRYSIGLSGLDPFVRARFNMPIQMDQWLIDPIQQFRYSMDDGFEEETNIYFDRKVGEKSLLRVQLYRSTQNEINGMNYALSAQYIRRTKKDTGFGFSQSFYGNTAYEYAIEKGVPNPKTKKYRGIHEYVTSATWRENIWRKWFYYEVQPSVSFHKQYDYEPNYRIRFLLDFYFGRHH